MAQPLHVWDDPAMEEHRPGRGHPERPERLVAARQALLELPDVRWHRPEPASADYLSMLHDPDYVSTVLGCRGRAVMLDEDTFTSEGTVDAALLAAGAVRDAVDLVLRGPDRRAIALVRPPGHHAERARAMGFCLFNNVALGAEHARRSGIPRVMVIDWDVHHGNGTQHLFEARPDVMFFSTHQGFGFYPGTGRKSETGVGNVINCPLPAGAGHDELIAAFTRELLPAAEAFAPGLVLVSAGFDAHRDDPLGGLRASEQTFAALCGLVRELADRHADGKLVLALEGGYDLAALAGSVRACADVLCR
jgi:acetoin utilization deacetylase AcuC-like enzyme